MCHCDSSVTCDSCTSQCQFFRYLTRITSRCKCHLCLKVLLKFVCWWTCICFEFPKCSQSYVKTWFSITRMMLYSAIWLPDYGIPWGGLTMMWRFKNLQGTHSVIKLILLCKKGRYKKKKINKNQIMKLHNNNEMK